MSRNFADPLQLLALAQSHHTAQEAADITGLALYTVREAARHMGTRFRDPRTPHPDVIARMAQHRRSGATYAQIGNEFGMTVSGVRKLLLRAGETT